MDFETQAKPQREESIVPMINVVFLLLIFFLMTSQIVPPEPFEVSPPSSNVQQDTQSDTTLYLDKTGQIGFEDLRGDAAIAAAAAMATADKPIRLRADAEMEAQAFARTLKTLTRFEFRNVELVVVSQ